MKITDVAHQSIVVTWALSPLRSSHRTCRAQLVSCCWLLSSTPWQAS